MCQPAAAATWREVDNGSAVAVGSFPFGTSRFEGIAMLGRPSDEEGLRLMIAFFSIMEPEKREEVVRLAETLAAGSTVVDGLAHFTMLAHHDLPKKPS
jgi:hypothetical protein